MVLKNSELAISTLEELKESGFNATIVSGESLRHAMEDLPEEHHFFNLRDYEKHQNQESIFAIFVLDEDKVEQVKNIIRLRTNNFQNSKGFMFTRSIEDYEGSI